MKQHQPSRVIAIAALIYCMHSKTFSQTDWHITGNTGTSAATNFVGTTDNQALSFRTNNTNRMRITAAGNIGIGTTAPVQKLDVNGNINIGKGFSLFMESHRVLRVDSLNSNTFLGVEAGTTNTTGRYNTATGSRALLANQTGWYNTAYGVRTLESNTSGDLNVGTGCFALFSNNGGSENTANGYGALYGNISGIQNSAFGSYALYFNAGSYNTALGYTALYGNNGGIDNTAVGHGALYNNTDGSYNTATGLNALANNYASENIAYGVNALYKNTTGIKNTGIGNAALYNNGKSSFNTAVGYATLANTTDSYNNTAVGFLAGNLWNNGWNNVFIGANADVNGTDYYNVVAIGESALCTGVSQARIGNSATNSIGGYANWANISDVRVKKNIKENVPGLAFINKLKPITYNLDLDAADKITQRPAKKDKDGKLVAPSQFEMNARVAKQQVLYTGFAAQDVEKAAKELNYDFSGVDAAKNSKDLYGLRYSDFVVPLVKAMQELSQKVEKLEAALAEKNSSDLSSLSSKNVAITDASLNQNIPNPFTRKTGISYTLPQKFGSAQILITDNSGKMVKQVNVSQAGKGVVNIDASLLSPGTYHYSLVVDGKLMGSKQMEHIK